MYEIDTSRTDLVEEFRANPDGPHSPELTLLVNRLRLMPFEDRHIIVCVKRGREWILARRPRERGVPMELFDDIVFDDYGAAVWELFKRRYKTVTGTQID